ncbi:MAG: hypothetical protein QM674_23105, partial [Burkholderiaceae bacterium]
MAIASRRTRHAVVSCALHGDYCIGPGRVWQDEIPLRGRVTDAGWIWLAAADPANLLGTVVTGPRLPRVPGARVPWRDGVPVATPQ